MDMNMMFVTIFIWCLNVFTFISVLTFLVLSDHCPASFWKANSICCPWCEEVSSWTFIRLNFNFGTSASVYHMFSALVPKGICVQFWSLLLWCFKYTAVSFFFFFNGHFAIGPNLEKNSIPQEPNNFVIFFYILLLNLENNLIIKLREL